MIAEDTQDVFDADDIDMISEYESWEMSEGERWELTEDEYAVLAERMARWAKELADQYNNA